MAALMRAVAVVQCFTDPNIQVGSRARSTTAPQALLLMNDPQVMEQATAAARRMLERDNISSEDRIFEIYRQVLGRTASFEEAALARQFVGDSTDTQRWAALYHALFQSLDFRFVD